MKRRASKSASSSGISDSVNQSSSQKEGRAAPWIALFVLFLYSFWAVHQFQYENLPMPQSIAQAGKRGFSEESAMEHVKALTGFGPRIVGSDALDLALQVYLLFLIGVQSACFSFFPSLYTWLNLKWFSIMV